METLAVSKSHGGVQGVYRHASTSTGTPMTFSVFVPPNVGSQLITSASKLFGVTTVGDSAGVAQPLGLAAFGFAPAGA